MKISVIIPFLNAAAHLPHCLPALARQTYRDAEFILVDNASTDASAEIVRAFAAGHPGLRLSLLSEQTPGASAARNKGALKARGDWLVFTDADCVPAPDWLERYPAHFTDDSVAAVAGCIRPFPPSSPPQKTLALFTLPATRADRVYADTTLAQGLFPTANLAVRGEVFGQVGGFNKALRYGEDHELCYRIYRAGYKIKAVRDAVVQHIHRTTLGGLVRQSFGFGTVHPYELRHFTPGRLILTAPFVKIDRALPGRYVWMDLNQADKKALGLALLGLAWWPLYGLVLLYFLRLCLFVRRQAQESEVEAKTAELPLLAGLLILKSLCLTCGRIAHSPRHRVLCL